MTVQRRRFKVLKQPIYYPTDVAVLRRLRAGEAVPWAECKRKTARVGSVVDDLPRESIAKLLQHGLIEEVPSKEAD